MGPGKTLFAHPVLGTVRAGAPQLASDEAFEFLSVSVIDNNTNGRLTWKYEAGQNLDELIGQRLITEAILSDKPPNG